MTVQDLESRDAAPADGETVGLRVFTHGKVNAAWLSQAISPAVRTMATEHRVGDIRLRRGWLNGPHVDILARDEQQTVPWTEIIPLITVGATGESELTEEAYLIQAREFGRLEQVPPPYLPLQKHGVVERLTPESLGAWGGPLDALREQVECRLSRQVMRTADRLVAESGSPIQAIAEAMVAAGDVHRAGLTFGTFSYRSHAEAFLSWTAQGKDVRPAFEQRRQQDLPWLRDIITNQLEGRSTVQAQQWSRTCDYALGVLEGGVATELLSLDEIDQISPAFDAATMGPPGGDGVARGSQSDFHAALDATGAIDNPPSWFAAYRALLNLLYEQFVLLGLPPLHRYYLCYAIAETVDEVDGTSWQDRLA